MLLPRLGAAAIAAGLLAGLAAGQLPGVHPRGAILIGWCAGIALHGALVLRFLLRASPQMLREGGLLQDRSRWSMIGVTAGASLAALGAVAWEIGGAAPTAPFSLPLGVVTIVLSWTFIHTCFAYHYAHAYWRDGGGLDFRGQSAPDGLEFLYFAFGIGMTCAVSDVNTTSPAVRRLVLAQGLCAFAFNARWWGRR
jgi:uncharacterized membrane protein